MASATLRHIPAAVVDQDDVEVTEGAQLAAAVAADGEEGQRAGVPARGPVGQA